MNKEKLYMLIRNYLSNNPNIYKIVTSNDLWYYSKDIFDNTKYPNFFEMAIIKKDVKDFLLINNFLDNLKSKDIKAIKYNYVYYYIYSIYPLTKIGKTFTIEKALLINEDIYNNVKRLSLN